MARPVIVVEERRWGVNVLQKAVGLKGIGVFSGQQGEVTVRPGEPGAGIVFCLRESRVPAVVEEAVDLPNCSGLGRDPEHRAILIEHVMSALWGLGVLDAEVALKGPEAPLLDGSAQPIVRKLLPHLRKEFQKRKVVNIQKPFSMEFAAGTKTLGVSPAVKTGYRYTLSYQDPPLNEVAAHQASPAAYAARIAPARTFIGEQQARQLQEMGVLKGGSEENAVVLRSETLGKMAWRLKAEAARHKILDMIGDLALVGAPVVGMFEGRFTGHSENRAMAKALREEGLRLGL